MARLDATGIDALHARLPGLADLKRLLIINFVMANGRSATLSARWDITATSAATWVCCATPASSPQSAFGSSVHYALTIPKVVRSACSVISWLQELGPPCGHRLVKRRQHTASIDRLGDRRSEATNPDTTGSARATAMSARQSPSSMPTACRTLTFATPLGKTNR